MDNKAPTGLQRLLDEPKGKTKYSPGEAFILHVFWEAPNEALAQKLLDGLEQCARATRRDTPCVPTYFFRLSHSDRDLYGQAPKLVKDHAQLASAIKKIAVGISRNAVTTDLLKRGIDPQFLELDLNAELPPSLQGHKPVAVEFTELYLDERAFMEHSGSREYLDAYAKVMSPGLSNHLPTTLRFGTPSQNMIDKILDPILRETVIPLSPGSTVWKLPEAWSSSHFMISVDVAHSALDSFKFSDEFERLAVWCVRYPHAIRSDVARLMAVFPSFSDDILPIFATIGRLSPIRGDVHVADEKYVESITKALADGGLSVVTVNASKGVGYILHEKVAQLHPESA